jgi:hypothetical protein
MSVGKLLEEPYFSMIDSAVREVAKEKHDKVATVDFTRVLRAVCNIVADGLSGLLFGFFEEVTQKAFSQDYEGVFRNLRGAGGPFVELYRYTGSYSFAKNQILLIDTAKSAAIDLNPLYIWGLNSLAGDNKPADLYMFDGVKGKGYAYNAVQDRTEVGVEAGDLLGSLWELLNDLRNRDLEAAVRSNVQMTRRH